MKVSDFTPFNPSQLLKRSTSLVRYFVGRIYQGEFSSDDIDDIIGDVVLKALEKAESYDPQRGTYANWLTYIALNTVKSAHYAKSRHNKFLAGYARERAIANEFKDYASAPDSLVRGELAQEHVYSKARSERDKTILGMKADGYQPKEIADELSIATGRVYQVIHKVKTRIDSAA